jgi:hypothetical protein
MTVEGQVSAGWRSSPGNSEVATKGFFRLLLSVVVVLGLGWLVPAGGLAIASATPAHHGDQRWRGQGAGEGRGHDFRDVHSATGTVTGLGTNEFSMVTEKGTTLDVDTANARYREPGVPSGSVSVVVGDKVQVRGSQQSSEKFVAKLVKIPQASAVGRVQAVAGYDITLNPVRSTLTSTSVTIVADGSASRYIDPGVSKPSISDVRVGELVAVRGTQEGAVPGAAVNTLAIRAAVVDVPRVNDLGVVGNLDTTKGTFTLTSTSSTLTINVNATTTTKYVVTGVRSATIDNLVNGDIARVTGNQEGTDALSATIVRVLGESHVHGDHNGSRPDGRSGKGGMPGSESGHPGGPGDGGHSHHGSGDRSQSGSSDGGTHSGGHRGHHGGN